MAPRTGLILLAAGASRRMGSPKQLLPIQGEPVLIFCLKRILAGGIASVVVVVGNHRQAILPLLDDLAVTTVINPEPDSQMSDSIRVGLTGLPSTITGVMVGLADHPLVLPQTYALLRRLHELHPERILIPTYRNRSGHPPLLPAPVFRRPGKFEPLNKIIGGYPRLAARIAVNDPGVVLDMDFPADYEHLSALAAGEHPAATPDNR